MSLAGNDGGSCEFRPGSPLIEALGRLVTGDTGDARFIGSSLIELGDTSSGFAIRKPPSDFDRLRSPSIGKDKRPRAAVVVLLRSLSVELGRRTYYFFSGRYLRTSIDEKG